MNEIIQPHSEFFGFNIYQQECKLFNTLANTVEFRNITLLSSEGEKTAGANEDMN